MLLLIPWIQCSKRKLTVGKEGFWVQMAPAANDPIFEQAAKIEPEGR